MILTIQVISACCLLLESSESTETGPLHHTVVGTAETKRGQEAPQHSMLHTKHKAAAAHCWRNLSLWGIKSSYSNKKMETQIN